MATRHRLGGSTARTPAPETQAATAESRQVDWVSPGPDVSSTSTSSTTSAGAVLKKARSIVVTCGGQKLSPIQFCTFEVGPLTMEIALEDGDDPKSLARAALDLMRQIQSEDFKAQHEEHLRTARLVGATK